MKLLQSLDQYYKLVTSQQNFVIFKHSGRCSVSGGVCMEVEQTISELGLENMYLLDVLHTGDLKYEIADIVGVQHESPQILIFEQGKLKHHASHGTITKEWLASKINTF